MEEEKKNTAKNKRQINLADCILTCLFFVCFLIIQGKYRWVLIVVMVFSLSRWLKRRSWATASLINVSGLAASTCRSLKVPIICTL
ncbi:hypothetical protein CCYS_13910 [Corynebacterium cystitidis DSM 20524]|uniref:Uncharacterized protein n=1 Tax=Corynebacterium cystitidis DSM 20524 TaxID=1121357 RepID=A0A1H9UXA1_9CORY|nr:hypothetical protein CCYS_13910 [Corynebacterium cystitidis DSM 20524]SES13958.1 hypothetical protein SAMN05661109_01973 [Corynebacterium cystitidis DSM 20524]SNV91452.1 Uncharacterised protein [Corynebacterium cystitidis]